MLSFFFDNTNLCKTIPELRSLCVALFLAWRKNILYFSQSFLIANEVTMLYAQLLPELLFSSPLTATRPCDHDEISHAERDQPPYHSHYLHSLLFCAWQYNYQSRGPVQLIASDCWQRGLEQRGWDEISTKGVLREKLFRCFKRRWQECMEDGEHGILAVQNDMMIKCP